MRIDEAITLATPQALGVEMPVLPLKNMVMLPKSIIPVVVGRAPSIAAVEAALKADRVVFVTAQKDQGVETPAFSDLYPHGTRAIILQVMRLPKGALKILVEGLSRATVLAKNTDITDYLQAACVDVPTTYQRDDVELEALWRSIRTRAAAYGQLNDKISLEALPPVATPEEMESALDTFLSQLAIPLEERQRFLELQDLKRRMLKLAAILEREMAIAQAEERIRGRVQTQVERNQRDYYLNEQIKAIQKELGRDEQQVEIAQLRAKLKGLKLPSEVHEKTEKEIKRLEQMPLASAEASVIRHYVDWIISLPWHKRSKDAIHIDDAEKILDKKHAGLKKVKERIVEFIAARKFSDNLKKAPIICLAGPPGVGKTSLAESIAESLGREFKRISLGGVRDEAEIRGHRRTYIGAQPGKIVQALRSAKTINPVILLDEVDKMTSDAHGDPGAALLEVLDPEQNKHFVDHFLEVPYDLSHIMFITTANMIDNIPYPLHDRMELISLSGYTEAEKMQIATGFLIPKNLKEHGLSAKQFVLSEALLRLVISEYTKEAGVRQLERLITKLIRKVIQKLLRGSKSARITITEADIRLWLGHSRFKQKQLAANTQRVGLSYGLAWTEVGGDVMEIETSVVPGKGNVMLTGQLGEVMQESAYAALSYIRARAQQFGLKQSFSTNKDIHIHVPEGATPKDGPSAGIAICAAIISALTKTPTAATVAMTGEITLRGRVLPVGGLKEKILAARQFGITTIILPLENKEEVEEFAHELNGDITLKFVDTMDEVIADAFLTPPLNSSATAQGADKKSSRSRTKRTTSTKKKGSS